jgi:hypothetical protein
MLWRRSGSRGQDGMERWLGLGVLASNLRRIARTKQEYSLPIGKLIHHITESLLLKHFSGHFAPDTSTKNR